MASGGLYGFTPDDFAQIDALMSHFGGGPQEEAQARNQAWLAALMASLSATRGHEGEALGRAGLLGMGTYQQAMNQSQERQLRRAEAAKNALGLMQAIGEGKQQALLGQALTDQGLLGGMPTPQAPAPALPAGAVGGTGMGGGVPALFGESTQSAPVASAKPGPAAARNFFDEEMAKADRLEALARDPKYAPVADRLQKMAEAQRERALKFRDEYFSQTELTMDPASGKLTRRQLAKYGPPRTLEGQPAEEVTYQSQGGALVPIRKYTGPTSDLPAIPVTMSPTEKDVSARAWTGLGYEKQRVGMEGARLNLEREKAGRPDYSAPIDVTVNGAPRLALQDKRTGRLVDPDTLQPIAGATPKSPEPKAPDVSQVRAAAQIPIIDAAMATLDEVSKNREGEGFVGRSIEQGRQVRARKGYPTTADAQKEHSAELAITRSILMSNPGMTRNPSDAEVERFSDTYFERPFDTAEQIKDKRAKLEIAVQSARDVASGKLTGTSLPTAEPVATTSATAPTKPKLQRPAQKKDDPLGIR